MFATNKITSIGATALALGLLAAVSLNAHAESNVRAEPKDWQSGNAITVGSGQVLEQRPAGMPIDHTLNLGFENVRKDISSSSWSSLSTLGKTTAETR